MAITIFILMLLAVFHFLMENIFIPIFRTELKSKLFSLRDRLFLIKIKNAASISDQTFKDLNGYICTTANKLPHLNLISLLISIRREVSKEDKSIENTISQFTNHKNEEVKQIFNESSRIALNAYFLNASALAFYFLPLVIIALLCTFIHKQYKKMKLVLRIYSSAMQKSERLILIYSKQSPCDKDIFYDTYSKNKGTSNQQISLLQPI